MVAGGVAGLAGMTMTRYGTGGAVLEPSCVVLGQAPHTLPMTGEPTNGFIPDPAFRYRKAPPKPLHFKEFGPGTT